MFFSDLLSLSGVLFLSDSEDLTVGEVNWDGVDGVVDLQLDQEVAAERSDELEDDCVCMSCPIIFVLTWRQYR